MQAITARINARFSGILAGNPGMNLPSVGKLALGLIGAVCMIASPGIL